MLKIIITLFLVAKALVHLYLILYVIFNWDTIKDYQTTDKLSKTIFKNPIIYFLFVYFLLYGFYLTVYFDLALLNSYLNSTPLNSLVEGGSIVALSVITYKDEGKPFPFPYSYIDLGVQCIRNMIWTPTIIDVKVPNSPANFILDDHAPDYLNRRFSSVDRLSDLRLVPSEDFIIGIKCIEKNLWWDALEFILSFTPDLPAEYRGGVDGYYTISRFPKFSRTHVCFVDDFFSESKYIVRGLRHLALDKEEFKGMKLKVLLNTDDVVVAVKLLLPKGLSFYKTIYFMDSKGIYPNSIKDFKNWFKTSTVKLKGKPHETLTFEDPFIIGPPTPSPSSVPIGPGVGTRLPIPSLLTIGKGPTCLLEYGVKNKAYASGLAPLGGSPLNKLIIVSITYDKHLRCLDISMYNSDLLEGLDLIKGIYNTLYTSPDWLGFSYIKILLSTLHLDNGSVLSAHPNRLVHNGMDIHEFIDTLVPFAPTIGSAKYSNGFPETVTVRSWSFNHPDNIKIKGRLMPISVISKIPSTIFAKTGLVPYVPKGLAGTTHRGYSTKASPMITLNALRKPTPFSTLELSLSSHIVDFDRESLKVPLDIYKPTAVVQKELLYPVSISICVPTASGGSITPCPVGAGYSRSDFSVGHPFNNLDIIKMWSDTIAHLISSKAIWKTRRNRHTVFIHDLGLYGIFLYKYLHLLNSSIGSGTAIKDKGPWLIEPLVDKNNKFISIILKIPLNSTMSAEPGTKPEPRFKTIVFKDSMRIFPISLKELCSIFKPQSQSLYDALQAAQTLYLKDYSLDIAKTGTVGLGIVSTSTLAYKIFIKNFSRSKTPIGSLKLSEDLYIRPSYLGGSTDLYKGYGENLYYYDVNSLYPAAMSMPMPIRVKGFIESLDSLENFFGICQAEVICPEVQEGGPVIPILPNKVIINGITKTTHPRGVWTGTYFSEELKACTALGYVIKPLHGISFEEGFLFNKYVDHFYKIKSEAKGAEKAIAKLCLNSLYGYFGRPAQNIKTIEIDNQDLEKYIAILDIKSIIKINEEKSLLLINKGLNNKNLKQLKNLGFDIPKLIEDANLAPSPKLENMFGQGC